MSAVVFLVACPPGAPTEKQRIFQTAPEAISYADAPFTLTVGVAMEDAFPTVTGGAPVLYTVMPALPPGLELDSDAGVISGTPTFAAPATAYTITGANGLGTVTTTFMMTIVDPAGVPNPTGPTGQSGPVVTAPSALAYPLNDATYVVNIAVPNNTPSVSGTAPFTFAVSPSLPAGLSLDTSTGVISGQPSAMSARTAYTVTASNSAGMTQTTLFIEVSATAIAPTLSGYSNADATYGVGIAITANVPSLSGTPPFTFSVMPTLPTGLTLQADGKITGTPTAVSARTVYTLRAENSSGFDTFDVAITIIEQPPSLTAYTIMNATYAKDVAITPNLPTVTGTPTIVFSLDAASPALPAGLTLAADGVISGTPTVASAQTTYIIKATNGGGSDTLDITITVLAPPQLAYPAGPVAGGYEFVTPGTRIPAIVPSTLSHTRAMTLSIAPALPSGLSFNTTNGTISGAPSRDGAVALTGYVVTAADQLVPSLRSTATVSMVLLNPLIPGQPDGYRQASTGPSAPTGPAGVGNNGVMIFIESSFMNPSSINPASATVPVGDSIAFKLTQTPAFSWSESIGAPSDWPSLPCFLFTTAGSTCVFGINGNAGTTWNYTNLHQNGLGSAPGSVTVQ